MRVAEFWEIVELGCRQHSASVTSGHRTRRRNAHLGGADDSAHVYSLAADIVLDDWAGKDRAITYFERQGLRVLDEVATKNHLHLDDRMMTAK
jgi:uncharacterized protein YcbK (DUF882 family)